MSNISSISAILASLFWTGILAPVIYGAHCVELGLNTNLAHFEIDLKPGFHMVVMVVKVEPRSLLNHQFIILFLCVLVLCTHVYA
jgi:hypothetical protein